MGARVLPCLERTVAVPKSAFAGPDAKRPLPDQHHQTMRVTRELLEKPARITVVDDFVTKGSTLLGAASLVKEAFCEAEVRGFALVRTMGLVREILHIVEPVRGRITFNGLGTDRQP
jgi:hypothetical protein